uniref:Uncharacterized protein n=1 Tax=Hemiselmis andersenii TaxID=464988 RepID=A0A7S1HD74_HEMAN|mmetsp:Transcript_54771/g.132520  ORF Transcript_54771/g.132520 Transcript_54771/m.132520 type:complete len:213 (+) Transcript_54771:140-778(+)
MNVSSKVGNRIFPPIFVFAPGQRGNRMKEGEGMMAEQQATAAVKPPQVLACSLETGPVGSPSIGNIFEMGGDCNSPYMEPKGGANSFDSSGPPHLDIAVLGFSAERRVQEKEEEDEEEEKVDSWMRYGRVDREFHKHIDSPTLHKTWLGMLQEEDRGCPTTQAVADCGGGRSTSQKGGGRKLLWVEGAAYLSAVLATYWAMKALVFDRMLPL